MKKIMIAAEVAEITSNANKLLKETPTGSFSVTLPNLSTPMT